MNKIYRNIWNAAMQTRSVVVVITMFRNGFLSVSILIATACLMAVGGGDALAESSIDVGSLSELPGFNDLNLFADPNVGNVWVDGQYVDITAANNVVIAPGGALLVTDVPQGDEADAVFSVNGLTGNTEVGGTLAVTGATTTAGLTNTGAIGTGTLATTGQATLNSASVTTDATVGGTLAVTGATT
ncbi:MAG: hypothetical protein ACYC9I_10590, partial [Desulfuromonadales bacterium]